MSITEVAFKVFKSITDTVFASPLLVKPFAQIGGQCDAVRILGIGNLNVANHFPGCDVHHLEVRSAGDKEPVRGRINRHVIPPAVSPDLHSLCDLISPRLRSGIHHHAGNQRQAKPRDLPGAPIVPTFVVTCEASPYVFV